MDGTHHFPYGVCSDCGYKSKPVNGPLEQISPGDYALCARCAALNIYADDLSLHQPTAAQRLAAAADPDVQRIRTIILAIHAATKALPDDTTH